MATGRTLAEFQRAYIDGYDMSGYVFDAGEQGVEYGTPEQSTWTDACMGTIPTKPTVVYGPLQGVFDNTATSGIHVLANAAQGARRNILHAYGIRGAPVFGDDCYAVPMLQTVYKGVGTDIVTARCEFGMDQNAGMLYRQFFGKLLHALGAETGANSANTNVNNGAATTKGGWLMWQTMDYEGTGSATISLDDSANGTTWLALSGATSGAIAHTSMPTAGIVQLGITATVRQYLRWQLSLSTLTSVSFALAFIRGR